jgi:arginase
MVAVSNPKCNTSSDKDIIQGHKPGRKNFDNVLNSSLRLERSTERALRHGLFPIVFGGDHSQAIGSISGLKKVHPEARVMWIDAHIDANTPSSSPSSNMHGMPVATLAGMMPGYNRKSILSLKHLIYFGIRSYEPEELRLLQKHRIPWYDSRVCLAERLPEIKKEVDKHFFPDGQRHPYWISFDIDGVDQSEFASTGTPEAQGISLDFMMKFFDTFLPEAVGMDFTEVNFLRSEEDQAELDMLTVRLIIEKVVNTVQRKQRQDDKTDHQTPSGSTSSGHHQNNKHPK